jgi:phage tail-like protein
VLSHGQTDYAPVRLERGITTDTAFEEWAKLPWYQPDTAGEIGSGSDMGHFRKDMQIEVYDEAGQRVLRYTLYHCWPSEYIALPELNPAANAVGLGSMTIEHEGWDRDTRLTPAPDRATTGP